MPVSRFHSISDAMDVDEVSVCSQTNLRLMVDAQGI